VFKHAKRKPHTNDQTDQYFAQEYSNECQSDFVATTDTWKTPQNFSFNFGLRKIGVRFSVITAQEVSILPRETVAHAPAPQITVNVQRLRASDPGWKELVQFTYCCGRYPLAGAGCLRSKRVPRGHKSA
jgi:hypothetical protein